MKNYFPNVLNLTYLFFCICLNTGISAQEIQVNKSEPNEKTTNAYSNTTDKRNKSDEGLIITKNELEINQIDSIYSVIDVMPEFPGGLQMFLNYLADNIKYPRKAKNKGIQGYVLLNFIVETDGSISNVRVLHSIGGGCDEEAVKVVKNMPKWKTGQHNGKFVRVSFNLPIKFSLKKNNTRTF